MAEAGIKRAFSCSGQSVPPRSNRLPCPAGSSNLILTLKLSLNNYKNEKYKGTTLSGRISPAPMIKATLPNLLKGGEAERKGRVAWRSTRQVVSDGPKIGEELQKGSPCSACTVDRVPLFMEVDRTSGLLCISLNPEGGGGVSMRKAAMLAATDHGFVVLTTGTAGDGHTIFKKSIIQATGNRESCPWEALRPPPIYH